MTTKTEVRTMHFTIEGAWLTWFLRHLWIEGSEEKAIKTWDAAFPTMTTPEHLNGFLLDILSGRKKFVGQNTFEMVDDGVKFWSTSEDGKPCSLYPLVSNWEDVLERKGIELFKAELDLRDMRLNRQYAPTRKGNGHRSDRWALAAIENGQENRTRKRAAELLATITNICQRTGLRYEPIAIPTEGTLLEDKSKADAKWPSRRVKNNPSLDNNKRFHAAVLTVLETARVRFLKKYGVELVRYDYDDIALLCGVDEAHRWAPHETLTYDVTPRARAATTPKKERSAPMSFADGLDAAIKQAMNEGDTQRLAMLNGFKNNALVPAASIIPGLSLDPLTYIQNMAKDEDRQTIEAESVERTTWRSGYIDRAGRFYGCSDIAHAQFSRRLCAQLGYLAEGDQSRPAWMRARRGEKTPDPEVVLDHKGWVRISVNRFYWDGDCRPNDAQLATVKAWMAAKGLERAVFNSVDPVTFDEGTKAA
jgi:hypothetical protein